MIDDSPISSQNGKTQNGWDTQNKWERGRDGDQFFKFIHAGYIFNLKRIVSIWVNISWAYHQIDRKTQSIFLIEWFRCIKYKMGPLDRERNTWFDWSGSSFKCGPTWRIMNVDDSPKSKWTQLLTNRRTLAHVMPLCCHHNHIHTITIHIILKADVGDSNFPSPLKTGSEVWIPWGC